MLLSDIKLTLHCFLSKKLYVIGVFPVVPRDSLAQEIGNWAIGECEYGQWIATSHEMLTVAFQFLIIYQQ